MTATLLSDRTLDLAGNQVRVRYWANTTPGESFDLATLSVTVDCPDVPAVAAAAEQRLGPDTALVLDIEGDLFDLFGANAGGWITDPINLPDLAADLGVDPGSVLP
jgi:hypothetical protein